jgi:hypothetical protein
MSKMAKMTRIKETLRSVFFYKMAEYHNFRSF